MSPRRSLCLLGLLLLTMTVQAQTASRSDEQSLEDLMQVEVSSVAKKPQRLANVAASIFVITAEDIRLSGANSIPEVLQLAPGIDASRLSGNRWSVSVRGFANRLANKLLVLVDGRTMFNPGFSGVLWESLQIPMGAIERIEVVRGPGASVWGSNAVNGVINIITKSAAATQGGQATFGDGTLEGQYGRLRWGGRDAERDLYYRAYATAQTAVLQRAPYGPGHENWTNQATGFRLDGYGTGGTRWDVSTDYADVNGDSTTVYIAPGANPDGRVMEHNRSLSVRARIEQKQDNGASLQLQTSVSSTVNQIAGFSNYRSTNAELGLQRRLPVGQSQDVILGGEYRVSSDTIPPNALTAFDQVARTLSYYSLFAQDELLLADTVHFTLGLRMDHSPYTGWEAQPTARLSWNLLPIQTLWGSASKAVRAPSRGEIGLNLSFLGVTQTIPGLGTLPVLNQLRSTPDFHSEHLQALELGLRSQWHPMLSTDVSVFSHHYTDLRMAGLPVVTLASGMTAPLLEVTTPIMNGGELTLNGFELSSDWHARKDLRLQLSYTYNDVAHLNTAMAAASNLVLPSTIASLRAAWIPPVAHTNVDLWWRYTGTRHSPTEPQAARNGFASIDVRLGWKPRKDLELSLTGQNINNGACHALTGIPMASDVTTGTVASCLPRLVTLQALFAF